MTEPLVAKSGAGHSGTGCRSISRELTLRLLAGLLLLVAILITIVYLYARSAMLRQFDYALASKARAFATLVQEEINGDLELEFADEVMPEFNHGKSQEFFQVWRPDGSTLERSKSLRGADLEPFAGSLDAAVARNLTLPDRRPGRAVGLKFLPHYEPDEKRESSGFEESGRHDRNPALIVVARSRDGLDRALAVFLSVLAGGGLVLALGTILIVTVLVRRGLSPIRRLADQTRGVGPHAPGTRLDGRDTAAELQPIYHGVNDLLDRLEQAFERERRFTKDVSHELRTPIAEAKASLEMSLKWPGDADLLASSSRSAVDALKQMEKLVAALLTLARAETDRVNIVFQDLDLRRILDTTCASLAQTCGDRRIDLAVSPEACREAPVRSCEVMLQSVVANVLANAAEYGPEASTVEIGLEEDGQGYRLTVRNQAPQLTAEDVRVMEQPFWRKDSSRTDSRHSGLGLSVVTSFCRRLAIVCAFTLDPTGRLTVELRVPREAG